MKSGERDYIFYSGQTGSIDESVLVTCFARSSDDPGEFFYTLKDTEDYIASCRFDVDNTVEVFCILRAADTAGMDIYTPPYIPVSYIEPWK